MRDFMLAQPDSVAQAAELLAAAPDRTALLAGAPTSSTRSRTRPSDPRSWWT